MKIAITGAMGVGKTTLANDLAGLFPSMKIIPEVARMAKDIGFALDKDTTEEVEMWMAAKQFELEKLAGEHFISDRCFIDILAYVAVLFGPGKGWFKIFLRDIINRRMDNYDLIILLPSGEFGIEDDGVRSTDIDFQKQIDSEIREILKDSGRKWHEIKGNPEERLQQVKDIISSVGA